MVKKIIDSVNEAEVMEKVLTAKNEDGQTALHIAAGSENSKAARQILDACNKDQALLKDVLLDSLNCVLNKKYPDGKVIRIVGSINLYCGDLVDVLMSDVKDNSCAKKDQQNGLIKKMVEEYLADSGHVKIINRNGFQRYLLTESINNIKDDIKKFLTQSENYNVAPDVIKEKLTTTTKSVNSKESFVEKLKKEKEIDSNPFNAFK